MLQMFYVIIEDEEIKLIDSKFVDAYSPPPKHYSFISQNEIGWVCVNNFGKKLTPSTTQPSKLISSGKYYYREISKIELMKLVGHPVFVRMENDNVKKILYKVLIHRMYD